MAEFIGWIGAALLFLGFCLLSAGKIKGRSFRYQLSQFFGAIGVGINCYTQAAWPAFGLELVWAIVALIAIISLKREKVNQTAETQKV